MNFDSIPVYNTFHFQCSKYTGRIYVLSEVRSAQKDFVIRVIGNIYSGAKCISIDKVLLSTRNETFFLFLHENML